MNSRTHSVDRVPHVAPFPVGDSYPSVSPLVVSLSLLIITEDVLSCLNPFKLLGCNHRQNTIMFSKLCLI